MKLRRWMTREKVTYMAMSDRIGRSHSVVQRYCTGERIPGRDAMVKIYVVTNGEVQPNDFYDLPTLAVNAPATSSVNGAAEALDHV